MKTSQLPHRLSRGMVARPLALFACIALGFGAPTIASGATGLPASAATVEALSDAGTVTSLQPDAWAVLVDLRDRPAATEPRTGRSYRTVAGAYLYSNGAWFLRFVAHADDSSSAPVARNAIQMLAVFWRSADRRWGGIWHRLRGQPLHVWATRHGEAGAEMWGTSLTIHDAHAPRSGMEWLRQIAHEYGHYLAPGGSGFPEPESWTNGVLGERLFTSWLRADLREGTALPSCLPWATQADVEEYCARQVDPLLERFREHPPLSADLRRADRRGFDACVELLLGFDWLVGGTALLDILEFVQVRPGQDTRGGDFEAAIFAWIAHRGAVTTRGAGPDGTVRVPLPRGVWRVTSCTERSGTVDVHRPGWVQPPSGIGNAARLQWRRVRAEPAPPARTGGARGSTQPRRSGGAARR
ncbi:MAG TPA: hypothetical protein VLH79_03270 [Chthonomonadales bacterium]|nr:hypothetical protein [Chthonomonadales bacterium]